MAESNLSRITSTPLDLSHTERTEDSGYHSNYSHSKNESLNFENSLVHKDKECVDFLFSLGEKSDHILIVKKILSYLSDTDLFNAAAVSQTWRRIITSISTEEKRLRHYVRKAQTTKENRQISSTGSLKTCDETRILQSPRTKLVQIQNIQSSSSSPITRINYRFEAYQKEGRKLKFGRRLFSCPKCKLPSHVDQKIQNTAECTNSTCRYRFCILCHCEEHLSKMCDFISTPVVRRQNSLVGTTNSKKNLKRLLL